MKYYAGIGSRKTPKEICELMTKIATILQDKYILRSGGADGADKAFEAGVTNNNKEIYLPWKGFNGNNSHLYTVGNNAIEIAKKYHPAWDKLIKFTPASVFLMGRNSYQIFGTGIENGQLGDLISDGKRSSFVIAYTSDGKASGGTGQALRIAESYGIPIYNLYNSKNRDLNIYKNL